MGWSALGLGVMWWAVMRFREWRMDEQLGHRRIPVIKREAGCMVMAYELVEARYQVKRAETG